MAYTTDFVVNEGVDLDTQLGQQARSVIVDNYTVSWLWIPSVGRSVPPLTYGFVGVLVSASQRANAKWQTPFDIGASPAGTGKAQVVYTDAILPPSNGTPVSTPTATSPVVLVTLPAAGGVLDRPRVQVTAGMQAIAVFSAQNPIGTVTIVGVQSGFVYLDGVPTQSSLTSGSGLMGDCHPIPLDPKDTGLHVTITQNNGAVAIVAFPNIPSAEQLKAIISGTANVNIVGPTDGAGNVAIFVHPILDVYGQVAGTDWNPTGIDPSSAGTAIYQAVQQRPTMTVTTPAPALVANTGVALILAPGVGNAVILRKIHASVRANPVASSVVQLGPTSGTSTTGRFTVVLGAATFPGEQEKEIEYDDFSLGDNTGLVVTATTAVQLDWVITYAIVKTAFWPLI